MKQALYSKFCIAQSQELSYITLLTECHMADALYCEPLSKTASDTCDNMDQ